MQPSAVTDDSSTTEPTAATAQPTAAAPTARPSSTPTETTTSAPQMAPVAGPTATSMETPAPAVTDDDGDDRGVTPTAQPVTDGTPAPLSEEPTAAPPTAVDDDGDDGEGGESEATDEPSASPQPTPAPTMEGEVGRLDAFIIAPSTALGTPSSAGTLLEAVKSLVKHDDQDVISVGVRAPACCVDSLYHIMFEKQLPYHRRLLACGIL